MSKYQKHVRRFLASHSLFAAHDREVWRDYERREWKRNLVPSQYYTCWR